MDEIETLSRKTEAKIKGRYDPFLVVQDKRMTAVAAAIHSEKELAKLEAEVSRHLERMTFSP